jgi:hypothetical protein
LEDSVQITYEVRLVCMILLVFFLFRAFLLKTEAYMDHAAIVPASHDDPPASDTGRSDPAHSHVVLFPHFTPTISLNETLSTGNSSWRTRFLFFYFGPLAPAAGAGEMGRTKKTRGGYGYVGDVNEMGAGRKGMGWNASDGLFHRIPLPRVSWSWVF